MGNFSPGGSNVEFHSERSQHFCCPLKVNVIECGGGSGGWGGGTGLSRIITSSKVYTEIRLAAKKKNNFCAQFLICPFLLPMPRKIITSKCCHSVKYTNSVILSKP